MVSNSVFESRFEYVLQRLRNDFSFVELSHSSPDRETSTCRIRVSHREVVPWEYTPFVMLCFQEGIEAISENDFEKMVEQGVATIKRILNRPPVGEFSYQGNICLGYTMRFEYQGPERRSGIERRRTLREKASGGPTQDAPAEGSRETDRRRRERRGDWVSEGAS